MGLSAPDCEGSAIGSLVCTCCPVTLRRESERQPGRKEEAPRGKLMPPFDVTNLGNAFDRTLTVKANIPATNRLFITGVMQNDNPMDKRAIGGISVLQKKKQYAPPLQQRIRVASHAQPKVEMMLSGNNYSENAQPAQIKQTRNASNRKSGNFATTNRVAIDTSKRKDDK